MCLYDAGKCASSHTHTRHTRTVHRRPSTLVCDLCSISQYVFVLYTSLFKFKFATREKIIFWRNTHALPPIDSFFVTRGNDYHMRLPCHDNLILLIIAVKLRKSRWYFFLFTNVCVHRMKVCVFLLFSIFISFIFSSKWICVHTHPPFAWLSNLFYLSSFVLPPSLVMYSNLLFSKYLVFTVNMCEPSSMCCIRN